MEAQLQFHRNCPPVSLTEELPGFVIRTGSRFPILKPRKSFYKTEVGQASTFAINIPGDQLLWKAVGKGKDTFIPALFSGPFKDDRHPEASRLSEMSPPAT